MRVKLPVMFAAVLLGCRPPRESGAALPGEFAPEFRLESLSGRRFYLNAQRGGTVVLVFWTTTCSACKREMVELTSLDDELGERGLTVAAVCADAENADAVRSIAEGLGLNYLVLLDGGGRVAETYGVRAFPTTVIVGPAGRVQLRREGYAPGVMRQIGDKVRGLLAEPEAAR